MSISFDNINILIDSEMLREPRRFIKSAWLGHIPFASYITALLRPSVFVELGTYQGASYSAICEIVERMRLSTKCFAIDTWVGDAHAGTYSEHVYEEFLEFHKLQGWDFSTLKRMTFDEAVIDFEDKSIDLLHIDGFHTYDAVRNDFLTWRCKLSDKAIVLFHDISSKNPDFGVKRFWDEIRGDYLNFSFGHSAGLGVLGYGGCLPSNVKHFFDCARSPEGGVFIRRLFQRLGDSLQFKQRWQDAVISVEKLNGQKIKIKDLQANALSELYEVLNNNDIDTVKRDKIINKALHSIQELSRYT